MNKDLKNILQSDCYRYYGTDKKPIFWKLLNRDLYCLSIYRKANYYHNKNKLMYLFYLYRLKVLDKKYGFHLPARTNVGYGMFIGHNGPININTKSIIGNNCNISIGVTIGQENRGKRKGAPTIGDRVWVGTNSVIVGKINIGNNVLIAPNSYVNFDVPENSIVIGNPARVVSNREDATEYYCHNVWEGKL